MSGEKDYKQNNLWKARNRVKLIAQANFSEGDKFITLTFNNENDFDITNIDESNKRYSLFVRRLARWHKDLKYISVLEFQKRGAVHYHLLCNVPYIKKSKLAKMWGHGFVYINQVKNTSHIVRYISKYMMKYADDERFLDHRRYFCSQKLVRPTKLEQSLAIDYLDFIRLKKIKPFSNNKYFSDYHGLIAVEKYNLSNLPAQEGKL